MKYKINSRNMASLKQNIYYILIILCVLWFPVASLAQDVGKEDDERVEAIIKKEPERPKVSFTTIALTDLPFENLYYRDGNKAKLIAVTSNRRSTPLPLPKSETPFFELYTDPVDPEAEDAQYQMVGRAPLITGTKSMLFFLRENASTKVDALPIEIFGVDDSRTKFKESTFRFFNFMSSPLLVEFDRNKFVVTPKSSIIKRLNLSKEGAFTPFILRNMKGETVGGTRLFSHASNREMVLIFPPKKGRKRLDIRYFSD